MKNFLILVALILSFAFDANANTGAAAGAAAGAPASRDETSELICKIVGYSRKIGGPMITIVIIGAALLAIFGRMPWPALFALGMFTAAFFGAPTIVRTITQRDTCTESQLEGNLNPGASRP